MGRSQFKHQPDVAIDNIYLDTENPRIRNAKTQPECLERVLRKEEQMLALIKSIASNQLTTMPILVSPHLTEPTKWVVKDGNRRIAALKLLNNPNLCTNENLRSQISTIKNDYLENIPNKLDCLSSDTPQAIINELVSRHSGAMGGAGQLNWSAYLRTIFLLNNELNAEYKRAGQFLFWAEEHNILVDDEFPITNVSRFFNAENLLLLGFKISNDELLLILPIDAVIKMANTVISDFSSGRKQVSDVFTPPLAEAYLKEVRKDAGIIEPTSDTNTTDNNISTKGNNNSGNTDNTESTKTSESDNSNKSSSPRPTKPHWDRKKIFWRVSPAPTIPISEIKSRIIISELNKLDVKKTPTAAFMLMRALIELSDNYYRQYKNIPDKNKLAKNVLASATSMLSSQVLNQSQFDLIQAYSNTDKNQIGIFNIDTLQKFIHRETHIPNYQTLNTFWDEISVFVRACWIK